MSGFFYCLRKRFNFSANKERLEGELGGVGGVGACDPHTRGAFKKNFVDFSLSSFHVHLLLTFAPSTNFSYIYSSSDSILLYVWSLSSLFKSFSRSFNLFSRSFFIFLLFLARILEDDIVNFRISNFIYSHFT